MKILSLWQPHASAIAAGLKKVETRSWPTNYRGPIAIHAAKKWDGEIREILGGLPAPVREALLLAGFLAGGRGWQFPLGEIVAVADLIDCRRTASRSFQPWGRSVFAEHPELRNPMELALGNYEPDRFGWVFREVRALPRPLAYKGGQGLRDLPPEIAEQLLKREVLP